MEELLRWLPAILFAFGIPSAIFTYSFQRGIDRKEINRNARRKAYLNFLDALFEHAEDRTEASRRAYDRSKIEMILLAPDAIVNKLIDVQEMVTMDMVATGPRDVNAAAVPLILAMRKDCFEDSEIELDELEYLVPIGKPTPLAAVPEAHHEPM